MRKIWSTLQPGLKHRTAGTCLRREANLNLKSKVFACLLRIVGSDPANTRGSDTWALVASAVGLRVSQPPCFPMPGCSQAAAAASPGDAQGQCLNLLPGALAEPVTPHWSHSRLKWCFTHKWTSSGAGPGEHGEGIAREWPLPSLMTPLIPAPALPCFVASVLVCVQRSPTRINWHRTALEGLEFSQENGAGRAPSQSQPLGN